MPENIGNHGLYCPDFDDYAAVALYMQDLGTRIDEALAAQLTELNEFLAPPAILLTNSAAVVLAAPGLSNTVFDTVLVNTSSFMSYDVTTGELSIGSAAGAPTTVPYERGAYTAGAGVRMSATGAVTVGSTRELSITVIDDTQVPVFPAFQFVISRPSDVAVDQNTGGNYGLVVKTNFLLSGTSGVRITHQMYSDNAASTTTIPAGSAFLWVIFNGAADTIEVA